MAQTLAKQFEKLWVAGQSPPDVATFLAAHFDATSDDILAVLLIDIQQRIRLQAPIDVERCVAALGKDRFDSIV